MSETVMVQLWPTSGKYDSELIVIEMNSHEFLAIHTVNTCEPVPVSELSRYDIERAWEKAAPYFA